MHVEVLVKDPTEIYACMIQVHKMASGIEGIVIKLRAACRRMEASETFSRPCQCQNREVLGSGKNNNTDL